MKKALTVYRVTFKDGKQLDIYSDKTLEELKWEITYYDGILCPTKKHYELVETKDIKDIDYAS